MNKYKAVIFDMDGTIIDTEKLWHNVSTVYLKNKGIPNYKEIIDKIKPQIHGLASGPVVKIIKDAANINDSVEEILTEKKKIAADLYSKEVEFIQGFKEFHKKLIEMGIPTAIATNAEPHGLKKANEVLGLNEYFNDHMYHIGDVNYIGKPSPDIYLYAAKKLGIDPKDCIAIEDSIHGLCAAKSANMYCIGINTANIREKLLNHAHLVVDHYDEIPTEELLQKLILK
jgi:beta-phosphoglucomutase